MLNKNINKPSLLNRNLVANKSNLHIYSYNINITYSPFVELFCTERKKTVEENRKKMDENITVLKTYIWQTVKLNNKICI